MALLMVNGGSLAVFGRSDGCFNVAAQCRGGLEPFLRHVQSPNEAREFSEHGGAVNALDLGDEIWVNIDSFRKAIVGIRSGREDVLLVDDSFAVNAGSVHPDVDGSRIGWKDSERVVLGMSVAPDSVPRIDTPLHVSHQQPREVVASTAELLLLCRVGHKLREVLDRPVRLIPPVFPCSPAPAQKAVGIESVEGVILGQNDGDIEGTDGKDFGLFGISSQPLIHKCQEVRCGDDIIFDNNGTSKLIAQLSDAVND